MFKNITKRDIKYLFLGFFAFFIIDSAVNSKSGHASFKKGWNDACEKAEQKNRQ